MKCPKCGGALEVSRQTVINGETLDVYQCDDCILGWEVEGETFPIALTFAVDDRGRLFDPANGEPLSLN